MTFNFSYNYPQLARDSGFKLRNYKDGPLDWRLIGSMEIDRILRDQSLEHIDACLNHLSEAPVGSILDSNILDSGIAKYFMLSQFSVQYLLFCRKFLEETVTDLRESHGASQMELATLKRSLSEANHEILQLHKKITQMEAIHEVIYPCHLCTKNFISNDALNLHISRKHSLSKQGKNSEVSQRKLKDRENDLTLINTIKLELEIKQLKERLNNAEREIKEKHLEFDYKNIPENVSSVNEKSEIKTVHNIGIQSNLSEIKERDDTSSNDRSTSSQNLQHLALLQEKLQELEKWKEDQMHQNSEFLSEVTHKMQDIGAALETSRTQKELPIYDDTKQSPSSIKDLEILLTKKVEEIVQATNANLENVIKKLETNYKDKLNQLEDELHKLTERIKFEKNCKHKESHIKIENAINSDDEHFKIIDVSDKNLDRQQEVQRDDHLSKETSVSESNHTFIKHSNSTHIEKNRDIHGNSESTSEADITENESTDVSTSIMDEENTEKGHKKPITTAGNKTHIFKKNNPTLEKPQPKPKIVTKVDAKKLTNKCLSSLGVDFRSKALSPFLKQRYLENLNERRSKLKLKNTQFYETRNKIKTFVDKLCSTKMPPNAKALLEDTKSSKCIIQKQVETEDSLSETEEVKSLKASTPLNEYSTTNDNGKFKERLERILASPIRRPDDRIVKAIIHREEKIHTNHPLPMPRKRVMFHQPQIAERRMSNAPNPIEKIETRSLNR